MSENESRTTPRAHIAFMAAPAHGHVNPSLALVRELVGRGHRVTFAINSDFAPLVEGAGATAVLYESTFPAIDADAYAWPDDDDQIGGMRLFFEEFKVTLPQIEAAYDADRPDVIVYDIGGFPAPVLAAKWGVPAIQLSPTHVGYEGVEEDLGVGGEPSAEMLRYQQEFEDFVAAQQVGLTAMDVQLPKRCMVALTRSFQLRGERVADHYTFVGPSIAPRELHGTWAPAGERPVVLVSLGSAYTNRPDFYRLAIEAFGDLDWQVVLSIGRHFSVEELGELPANVEAHQWVPQLEILAHASAFVTHAGMGSTMEGLYHGVPLIAVPQAAEQPFNAARIAELGLGVHLPKDEVTAAGLRAALLSVSSDAGIAERLAAMREEIAAAGGPPVAADIVESYLR